MTLHGIAGRHRSVPGGRALAGLLAAALMLLLSGCDGYPADWPKADPAWTGCPEIAGTYRIDRPEGGESTLLQDSILGYALPLRGDGPPWDTMTVKGKAAEGFDVFLTRDPATVRAWQAAHAQGLQEAGRDTLDPFSPAVRWSEQTRQDSDEDYLKALSDGPLALRAYAYLRAGVNYYCEGGWVSGRRMTAGDDGEPVVEGRIRFARDKTGGLVAHATHNSLLQAGKVCRFGLCIPIPFGRDTHDDWARWRAAPPDNGALPWLTAFHRDPAPSRWLDVQNSADRLDEVRGQLDGLAIQGLTVEGVKAWAPGSVLVTLSSRQTLQFNLLFQALSHAGHFREIEVTGFSGDAVQGYRIEVSMGLMPRPSDTSRTLIRQRIEPLLPGAASVSSIEPFLDGFRVIIHTTDERVMGLAERNIKESDQFERVQVETHYYDGDSRDLVLKVWEKARTPYWPGSASRVQ